LRHIAVTGLVAIAAALGTWAAVPAATAATTTAASSSTAATSVTAAAALGPAGPLAGSLPGADVAPHQVAYPAGVAAPATTSPIDLVQDVSCFHAGDCIAVGLDTTANDGRGSLLGYLWNGHQWKTLAPPAPSGNSGSGLFSVSCKTGTGGGCYASGYYWHGSDSYPFVDVWTAVKWVQERPSAPGGSRYTGLTSLSCYSGTDCVAVGSFVPGGNTSEEFGYAEVWNGHTWRESSAPHVSSYSYQDFGTVSCPASTFCLAGGQYATSDDGFFETWVERFDGSHWTKLTDAVATPEGGVASYLSSISCTSTTSCVAVGEGTNAVETSSPRWTGLSEELTGTAWAITSPSLPTCTDTYLNGVSCTSATSCIAVGGKGPYNYPTTGTAFYALWNGSTWGVRYLYPAAHNGNQMGGIECLTSTYCVTVGNEGPYNKPSAHGLSAFWNGTDWTQINTPT
jgi:hypothetical protein